mmetsp:Transcript_28564/g.25281  ORF Transcript_28564/g.25281 Transcript_28564/m.25281 type:complete len:82 (+) Transcript_28564:355-600(+)
MLTKPVIEAISIILEQAKVLILLQALSFIKAPWRSLLSWNKRISHVWNHRWITLVYKFSESIVLKILRKILFVWFYIGRER